MDQLTEERVEAIARKAAQEVVSEMLPVMAEASAKRGIEMLAAEVGMSMIKKIAVLLGIGALAVAAWLFSKGVVT